MLRNRIERPAAALLTLCAAFVLAACAVKIDTSLWRYYDFEELGAALALPEDLEPDGAAGALFHGKNAELELTVSKRGELFADLEELAADAGGAAPREAEIAARGGVPLVRLSGEDRAAEYDLIGLDGDAYRVCITIGGDVKEKRAAALLAAVWESVCSEPPAGAETVRVRAAAHTPDPDYLVLVNRRRALPENWEETLDLATTADSSGALVRAERGVCKAFFALRRALAREGVQIGLASALGSEGEHPTGLALDLSLTLDGRGVREPSELLQYPDIWARVHARLAEFGFILRYPADGTYETGHACEPWHIRYVGAGAAREIAERGVTLEEYLGTDPAAIDYLVLVNAQNALPEGWEDEVEIVYTTNRHGENVGVERTAYAAYCGLRDALAAEGAPLDINSAYRTVASQQALAASYLEKYGADYVKRYVAVPGYSEHRTGLALDLYLQSPDVWAKIHARLAEFGFILRYPEGKEAITGYAYEPWHVRYVGVGAAREIAERGLALEEYLNAA